MERLTKTIEAIAPIDDGALKRARQRLANQAKPAGSLGLLEDAGARLAAIAGTLDVRLDRKVIVVCAGDHGVTAEGVSLFPQAVTAQMVYNFVAGGASINVLARHAGAEVRVADLGVNYDFEPDLPLFHKKVGRGTDNFVKGPAMSRQAAVSSVRAGVEIVEALCAAGPVDMIGTGDMGIGNTTPSTAIISAFSGVDPAELTGRGTGIDDQGWNRKVAVVRKGLAVNAPDPGDALDVLAKVGGFEIGGLAGLVLGAAARRIPVVCDGLISTAGALIACGLAPLAGQYLFAGHRSVEVGHRLMLQRLGLEPLLDLRLRLGEGTGAALAMELLDAASRALADIKTFDEVNIQNVQK